MRVSSISVKNKQSDKPNEDFFLIDEDSKLFLVVDGVSRDRINGVYPNPSPSARVARVFSEFIKDNHNETESLLSLFTRANFFVSELNSDFHDPFKPGIVAVCIRLKGNVVEWLSIGDCIGLLFQNNNAIQFNTQQTKKLRAFPNKFNAQTIRTAICNNPEHILGYGVIDGNLNARLFLESGSFDVYMGDTICLLSDGLEILLDNGFINAFFKKPLNELVIEAETLEILKGVRTDDKTCIKIEI